MGDFSNRITLITGAANGIGRAVALRMAAAGSRLVLWDVDEQRLSKISAEIARLGGSATGYCCDVSDRDAVYSNAERVIDEVGRVNILVNNAGVVSGRPFLECTDEQIRRTMEVNVMAHFWTAKAFLPGMIEADDGHIVTISSAGGIVGSARLADYSASKFAVFGFDEALREEFKKQGLNIHTTVVCPYFINTGMFAGVKTRFSFLLPILDESQVADRIVNAIARKKRRLLLPPMVYTVWLLRYLPVSVFDWIVTLLGVNSTMDNFHGRRPG